MKAPPHLQNLPIVAVTGSIGSGKSSAARCFEQLGCPVIDADVLARQAVEPGGVALEQIVSRFGTDVLLPDGRLNRKRLGSIVFSDAEARRDLERIVHPQVRALYFSELDRLARAGRIAPFVVYVVPLLFESGIDYSEIKAVVVVAASKETSIRRIMARDGMSSVEAERRYRSQIPIEEKRARADLVIENEGSERELQESVREAYRKLHARFVKRP